MDLSRENFHSIIFYDFKGNMTAQQNLAWLRTALGDETPYKTTIYNLFAEFKCSCVNLNDEVCDGRSSTAMNDETIGSVRLMIEIDKHVFTTGFGHP
ncbi:hypothetical protein EVAR_84937_1 [Eumeta japonica]|uniref:Mos1 transposase HTH domain-containing protein n=1 Tax=Eumeta variegata TaxID=151549 RepID=A0A4C1VH68_EUMVA|nr:hypothetical protein EVAR_84937_1 [Eumeta japonica]